MLRISTKRGVFYEISSRQALNRGWWPQNQRESRRCILERREGDRRRAPHDIIGLGRCNRFPATTRYSVIGHSAFCARFLSRSALQRERGAQRSARDGGPHGA